MLKQVIKNSMIYVVLGFLPPAVNFFLVPLYTEYLTPDQFGLIALGSLVQSVAINIIALGLDGAFSRFFFEFYKEKNKLEQLFSTAIIALILSGTLSFLLLLFLGQPALNIVFKNTTFTYFDYAIYSVITGIFTVLQSIILIYYRNKEEAIQYGIFSVFSFLLIAGCIVTGVVILEKEALGSIVGRAVGTVIPVVIFLLAYFVRKGIHFKVKLLPDMLRYGIPLMPYLLLGLLFNSLDKLLIERFFDLNELGLYNFAFLVASAVSIFISSMQSAINPRIFKELTNNKTPEYIARLYDFLLVSVSLIVTLVLAGVNPAIVSFIDSKYHGVVTYLPLLIVSFVPRIYYIIYSTPIFFKKKTKVLPWINLISLTIGFGVAYVLIQEAGIFGVVIAVFVIKLIQFLSTYIYIRKMRMLDEGLSHMKAHGIPALILLYIVVIHVLTSYFTDVYVVVWAYIPLLIIVGTFTFIKYNSLILGSSSIFRKRINSE